MNLEKFEEILRWKYDNGKRKFIGNLSGNHYEIVNPNGKVRGYTLFVNDKAVKVNTHFFGIACEIWDTESEMAGVPRGEA